MDDNEESAFVRTRPEEILENYSGGVLSTASGEVAEPTYRERKALSAAGQWGRVKEMPNGCWEWQGAKNSEGYGVAGFRAKTCYVHRLVCEMFNGPLLITEDACHSCNNPACCNPKHLAPGSRFDNAHDREEHYGRGRPALVTTESIAEARALYQDGGWSFDRLGKRYGVTGEAMRKRLKGVRRADSWRAKNRVDWPHAEEATALYLAGGWSVKRLADHFGASVNIVRQRLNGVARPDRKPGSGRPA